jgi:hypothetical protein
MSQRAQPIADLHPDPADASLVALLRELVDQERATVVVPPHAAVDGFWFGAGNAVVDPAAGTVWLVGRYRDSGDSRTGVLSGARGLELALFRSEDDGHIFEQVASWSKAELSRLGAVTSIEGSALARRADGGWEMFVALEKDVAYPAPVAALQKPGTGVWSIDRLTGPRPDAIDAATQAPCLAGAEPDSLHVKDPVVFREGDMTHLYASVHPASWASSNTAWAARAGDGGAFSVRDWQFAPRGPLWDVAVTRVTHRWPVPRIGRFADLPARSVYLYDGAECMRPLDENPRAAARPRGYSCEELGGALWSPDDHPAALRRLSRWAPLFVSPYGTGCSRYLSLMRIGDQLVAMWQQGQPDGSQPLVAHRLPWARVAALLGG